jgi:hypothetical protein
MIRYMFITGRRGLCKHFSWRIAGRKQRATQRTGIVESSAGLLKKKAGRRRSPERLPTRDARVPTLSRLIR